jgi:hypothetical protein
VNSTFKDGAYHFEIITVCTPGGAPAVRSFFAKEFPADGWIQSNVYPYSGNATRPCGDAYCWAWRAQGGNTTRWSSLEDVKQKGSVVVYNIRLANLIGS